MPIALFPELAKALKKVGSALAPWDRLVALEEQILRRARSAFLVHWFGPQVPERRLSLFIIIMNIGELRQRYALVKRSMPGPLPEMSLLAPLAGMAGFAAGLFFSPSGIFLFAPHIHSLFDMLTDEWWGDAATFAYSLVLNWIMPLLGPGVVSGLGAPLLITFALAAALGGERRSRAAVRLLGDGAMLIDAFLEFWDQISGDEEQIRNPVVRTIMRILRRFSTLFAHVLGFVSLLVTRVFPLIANLIGQFRAAVVLGREVLVTLQDIAAGFADALLNPFKRGGGLRSVFNSVLEAFLALPEKLMTLIGEAIEDMLSEFGAAFDTLNQLLGTYIEGVRERIKAAFEQTPVGILVTRIQELISLVPQLTKAFGSIGSDSIGDGGSTDFDDLDETLRSWWMEGLTGGVFGEGLGSRVADVIRSVRRLRLPTVPDLNVPDIPSAPVMPDVPALRSGIGLPAPVDFAGEAARMLTEARAVQERAEVPEALLQRPRSAFAEERRRLAAIGRPVLSQRDRQLRDVIYFAVGRVLPPALRIYAPRVRGWFDLIDQQVYGVKPPTGGTEELPQQELRDSGRLRPVVNMLTIRSAGGYAPDLRAFRDMVIEAMQRQDYLAPDAA